MSIFFNLVIWLHCKLLKCSLDVDARMTAENLLDSAEGATPQYSVSHLLRFYLVHPNFHMNWTGIEPGLLW
jgi:hypothetical protein